MWAHVPARGPGAQGLPRDMESRRAYATVRAWGVTGCFRFRLTPCADGRARTPRSRQPSANPPRSTSLHDTLLPLHSSADSQLTPTTSLLTPRHIKRGTKVILSAAGFDPAPPMCARRVRCGCHRVGRLSPDISVLLPLSCADYIYALGGLIYQSAPSVWCKKMFFGMLQLVPMVYVLLCNLARHVSKTVVRLLTVCASTYVGVQAVSTSASLSDKVNVRSVL